LALQLLHFQIEFAKNKSPCGFEQKLSEPLLSHPNCVVLTLLQDIVKLMFEMTNASECHRDAVFVCGGDRFVVFDRSAETGDWCQACARLLSLWERLGEGAKLESQKSQA
jgi:hypothetical protein